MKTRTPILLLTVVLVLLAPMLMADLGPKPSASFDLVYEIKPVPDLVSASLYDCDDPLCEEAFLLEELGPQGFDCTQFECTSLAYGYREYLYIVLEFSDGVTRQSNIFTKEHFSANYQVTVRANDLLVEETGGSGNSGGLGGFIMISALSIILAVICPVVLVVAVVILAVVLIVRSSRKRKAAVSSSEEA